MQICNLHIVKYCRCVPNMSNGTTTSILEKPFAPLSLGLTTKMNGSSAMVFLNGS